MRNTYFIKLKFKTYIKFIIYNKKFSDIKLLCGSVAQLDRASDF